MHVSCDRDMPLSDFCRFRIQNGYPGVLYSEKFDLYSLWTFETHRLMIIIVFALKIAAVVAILFIRDSM